ncbi:MAG: rhodanese-related sulfurtransferase [Pseudobacteriovorax sp.]|nr:rhodanese-related sulfurtransferase [Pseudobacteriovorax sp.]
MTQELLHNKFDRPTLEAKIAKESFERKTISFYRYFLIADPSQLRDTLYREWESLGCLGRIYLAEEGVNAQMSIPLPNWQQFEKSLEKYFPNVPLKIALADEQASFVKLCIKVKKRILADGLDDGAYDVTNVGKHLSARDFNEAMEQDDTVIVDMRNAYESEVGYFKGAVKPDVLSFSEQLPVVTEMLQGKEDQKILLYCTGGIRCEKTSAWLKHKGFKDVNQLHGGIIDYVRQVKEDELESKFIGKNFVFDDRLGERVTDDVVAHCHICGTKADTQRNCKWKYCHTLHVSCDTCFEKYDGCCSEECLTAMNEPIVDPKWLVKKDPLAAKRNTRRVAPKAETESSL